MKQQPSSLVLLNNSMKRIVLLGNLRQIMFSLAMFMCTTDPVGN